MLYTKYLRKDMINICLGTITWTSLTSFMLVAKSELGINNITIMETIFFLIGLVGVRLANENYFSLKTNTMIDNVAETIFLLATLYTLYIGNMAYTALAVYGIMFFNVISRRVLKESIRRHEDKYMVRRQAKRFLEVVRAKSGYVELMAGVGGTLTALLAINYLNVELILFAKIMILLNIVENIYVYYITNKYL